MARVGEVGEEEEGEDEVFISLVWWEGESIGEPVEASFEGKMEVVDVVIWCRVPTRGMVEGKMKEKKKEKKKKKWFRK